jgi:hypothetical protein
MELAASKSIGGVVGDIPVLLCDMSKLTLTAAPLASGDPWCKVSYLTAINLKLTD